MKLLLIHYSRKKYVRKNLILNNFKKIYSNNFYLLLVNFLLEVCNDVKSQIENFSRNFNPNDSENLEKLVLILEEIFNHLNEVGGYENSAIIFPEYFYKILLIILPLIASENSDSRK